MSWRPAEHWNALFVEWVNQTGVYQKPFEIDKLKPTYMSDFYRWSLAEEAFCAGVRLGLSKGENK